jgi:hydroxymethylpyrimidine/phosphomethylpyrimidine kinase
MAGGIVASTPYALPGLLLSLIPLVGAGTVLSTVITSVLTKMAGAGEAVSTTFVRVTWTLTSHTFR